MNILALSGRPNSGKDTVAEYLSTTYSNVKHLKCAHPLQDLTAYMIDVFTYDNAHRILFSNNLWKDSTLYEINDKVYSPRQIQKILGHSLREAFGQKLFGSMLMNRITELSDNTFVVVSDVRRPQEVELLAKHPGTIFAYISREETDKKAIINPEHQNETEAYHEFLQANAHIFLDNNRSLQYLYDQIDDLYNTLMFGDE